MKKVKWGVIGCGGIADRRTLPGMMLADNAELVAVMDVNPVASEKCKEKYGAKYAFSTVEELLAVDEIEAVYIATPVVCHREQAMAAADAGKHILLEKPIALTSKESQEIVDYCRSKGVKLGIGLMMRFSAYHKAMHDMIEKGEIGEIVSMRAQFTCWYPEMENCWRQKWATSGGGALTDMGVHCIDLLQYITGMKATDVIAFTGNQIFKYEVEDSASVIMRMENGCCAYVDTAFNIPDDAAVCKLEFYGTAGSIFAEGTVSQEEVGTVKVTRTDPNKAYDAAQVRSGDVSTMLTVETGNMYTKEVEAFGNAILTDSEPPINGESAVFDQRIIEAAYESNNTGCKVSL